MSNDWILDVLSDVKMFAKRNGLVGLAEQLDEALVVAALEISNEESRVQDALREDVVSIRATLRESLSGPHS